MKRGKKLSDARRDRVVAAMSPGVGTAFQFGAVVVAATAAGILAALANESKKRRASQRGGDDGWSGWAAAAIRWAVAAIGQPRGDTSDAQGAEMAAGAPLPAREDAMLEIEIDLGEETA